MRLVARARFGSSRLISAVRSHKEATREADVAPHQWRSLDEPFVDIARPSHRMWEMASAILVEFQLCDGRYRQVEAGRRELRCLSRLIMTLAEALTTN